MIESRSRDRRMQSALGVSAYTVVVAARNLFYREVTGALTTGSPRQNGETGAHINCKLVLSCAYCLLYYVDDVASVPRAGVDIKYAARRMFCRIGNILILATIWSYNRAQDTLL